MGRRSTAHSWLLATLAVLYLTTPVLADDALSCALCHHPTGQIEGEAALRYAPYPQIAGLPARYLQRQLYAYRDGRRSHALMGHVASLLSDEQIAIWARAYAAAGRAGDALPKDAPALGVQIATEGLWARGVPSCQSCHAADDSRPSLSPPLAGLSATYIHEQLRAYAKGERDGGPMGRMAAFASNLTDEEMAAVAAFYGGNTEIPSEETMP